MFSHPCNNWNQLFNNFNISLEKPVAQLVSFGSSMEPCDPRIMTKTLSEKVFSNQTLLWFFHKKLEEFVKYLKPHDLKIEKVAIQGSSVDKLRKGTVISPGSDIDIQLSLMRMDKNPIDEDLAQKIDATIKIIFSRNLKSKKKFNRELPFANYKIPPIDLSVYFRRVKKVDCTSSHDGRKIVFSYLRNNFDELELTQSDHVTQYCSLEEACDLSDHYQFRVSDQHALDVGKDALLIYLRNVVQLGLAYVDENHHPLDPMRLYRICMENFFNAYVPNEKSNDMGLADRLKGFINEHFHHDTRKMRSYLEKLTHLITDFALSQKIDRKKEAIHLLNNIGNYTQRQRKFEQDDIDSLDRLVEAEIDAISAEIKRKENIGDGGVASSAESNDPSLFPVQLPVGPSIIVEDNPTSLAELSSPPRLKVDIADSKEEMDDVLKIHPKALDERPSYSLKNFIQDYRTLPGIDAASKANFLIWLLENPGSKKFGNSALQRLESHLVLFLTKMEVSEKICLQTTMLFLKFQPDQIWENTCKLIADQFAISFLMENNNENESGMKYEIYQTYSLLSPSQKETVIKMLCLSSNWDIETLSQKRAIQLLIWIAEDCKNIPKELMNHVMLLSTKVDEKKREKWVHAIAAKYKKSQGIVGLPTLELPNVSESASSPIQLQTNRSLQEEQLNPAILKEMDALQQEVELLILEQNWIKALKAHLNMRRNLKETCAIPINVRQRIEKKLKLQLEQVNRGFKSFLIELNKQPASAEAIIRNVEEFTALECPEDLKTYQILIMAYAEIGNYPFALLNLIKTIELELRNLRLAEKEKIERLVDMASLIRDSIRDSKEWREPVKAQIYRIVDELRIHPFIGNKRKPYHFERTFQEIKDCMAHNHPQRSTFILDESMLLNLANFFMDSLPEEAFRLSEKMIAQKEIDEELENLIAHDIDDNSYAVLINTATCFYAIQNYPDALYCYQLALAKHMTPSILLMCCRLAKKLKAHSLFLDFYKRIDCNFNNFDFYSQCPEIMEINLLMGDMFKSRFYEDLVMQDCCWSIIFRAQAIMCGEKYNLNRGAFSNLMLRGRIVIDALHLKTRIKVARLKSFFPIIDPMVKLANSLYVTRRGTVFSMEELESIQIRISNLRPMILNRKAPVRLPISQFNNEKMCRILIYFIIPLLFLTTITVSSAKSNDFI